MTVLVTGSAGFIGANFVLDWIASGDEPVVNLNKLTYAGNLDNLQGNPRHIFAKGDIGDIALLERLLAERQPTSDASYGTTPHSKSNGLTISSPPFSEGCARRLRGRWPRRETRKNRGLCGATDKPRVGALGAGGSTARDRFIQHCSRCSFCRTASYANSLPKPWFLTDA